MRCDGVMCLCRMVLQQRTPCLCECAMGCPPEGGARRPSRLPSASLTLLASLWMTHARASADMPQVNAFVHLSFSPYPLKVFQGSYATGFVNASIEPGITLDAPLTLYAGATQPHMALLRTPNIHVILGPHAGSTIFNLTVYGNRLGRTKIRFYVSRNISYRHTNQDLSPSETTYNEIANGTGQKNSRGQSSGNVQVSDEAALIGGEMVADASKYSSRTNLTEPDDRGQFKRLDSGPTSYVSIPVSQRNHSAGDTTRSDVWWLPWEYDVVIARPPSVVEKYLNYIVMTLIAINLSGLGGQVDCEEVLYLVKRPVVVALSMLCRFGIMPALGLGLVELMRPDHRVSLGLLSLLCAPAEGASNLLVLLMEGDVTLSVTLTNFDNFATVAALPLWTILFETRIYDNPGTVSIPFRDIVVIFGYQLLALCLGAYIQRKFTKAYNKLWVYLPALTVLTLLVILAFEIYNNSFTFRLISAQLALMAALLSAAGYLLGAAVTFIARQPLSRVKAVSIETGARTSYISTLLLSRTLQDPDGDIARTAPVLCTLLSITPALATVLIYRALHRHKSKNYSDAECAVVEVYCPEDRGVDESDFTDELDSEELTEARETAM